MNLIERLNRMAEQAAHYQDEYLDGRFHNCASEDREAIETVRAMQEALRKIAAIENKEYGPEWEEIDEARDIANEALRRAGGES